MPTRPLGLALNGRFDDLPQLAQQTAAAQLLGLVALLAQLASEVSDIGELARSSEFERALQRYFSLNHAFPVFR